ncbi:MAG: GAF domain-containing protein, partial [bacterium]|nr:GAF domain-containing protein [bacterium]
GGAAAGEDDHLGACERRIIEHVVAGGTPFAQAEIGDDETVPRAYLCLPLTIGETTIGVLSASDRQARPDLPLYFETMQVIANYLAQAIQRKRAEQELQKFMNELIEARNLAEQHAVTLSQQSAQLVQARNEAS